MQQVFKNWFKMHSLIELTCDAQITSSSVHQYWSTACTWSDKFIVPSHWAYFGVTIRHRLIKMK